MILFQILQMIENICLPFFQIFHHLCGLLISKKNDITGYSLLLILSLNEVGLKCPYFHFQSTLRLLPVLVHNKH